MANISKAEKAKRAAEAEAAKSLTSEPVAILTTTPIVALATGQLGALSSAGVNAIELDAERIAAEQAEQQRIAKDLAERERLDEQRKREEAEALAKLGTKPDDSHLIAVTKDGETLDVHPVALKQHQGLGWKLVDA